MILQRFLHNNKFDLKALFELYHDRPAIVQHGRSPKVYTFEDIFCRMAKLSGFFKTLGIAPNSRVALYSETSPLHFLLFFLSWTENYLFIPLNVQMPLGAAVKESTPDVIIGPDLANPLDQGANIKYISTATLLGVMESQEEAAFLFPEINLGRECSLVFTSGSTGSPRGVVHTIGNHLYSAAGVISFFVIEPGSRWLVSLPVNHVGGLSIFTRMLLSGSAVIFPETRHGIENAVSDNVADFVSVVPTQLIRMIKSNTMVKALCSMRAILLGGSATPGWVIDRALDLSLPIVPSYGSTESCSLVTAVAPGSDRAAYKTAGKPLPYRKLAKNTDGRIMLGGKTRFACYLENGEKVMPFDDGWFITSDIGKTDACGNWIILGRADDIFISGGENINPFEIEKHIMDIAGVDTAVVVPAPHPEFGQVGWAFISSSRKIDAAEILSILKKILSPFKLPKKIVFIRPGEAAAGIKVDRAHLKEKAKKMAGSLS